MAHRTAAILSIGDELTLGQNLDTNSRWLSQRLSELGIITTEHATVPDDLAATRDAMLRLAQTADLVIGTGGLGPTADDLTRHALAAAMGDDLVEDPASLAALQARFAGREMPAMNRVQALRPSRGEAIPNPNGTAPGLRGTLPPRGVDVYCLPGPPREMQPMFEAQVVPALRPPADRAVRTLALHTFGLGESHVATRLGDLMARTHSPLVGTTASGGVVTCRVRYEGPPGRADTEMAGVEADIRARLGPYLFGAGPDTLASAALTLLTARGQSLAVVESCTGGLLGSLLTDIPGSSAAFLGGWITYTDRLKQELVGVPANLFGPGRPGAVSREVAEAMARGSLDRSGADHALSITGIAGPGGGSEHKPVGAVWIALASRSAAPGAAPTLLSRRFQFTGDRATIRDWAAKSAIAMLRFALIGAESTRMLRQAQ